VDDYVLMTFRGIRGALRLVCALAESIPILDMHIYLVADKDSKDGLTMNYSRLTAASYLLGLLVLQPHETKAQTTTTTETNTSPSTGSSSTTHSSDVTAAPMTKSKMKEQKRQQKHEEKAASEKAKAAKDAARNQKHEDTAVREQEAAQPK
jgi:hypothetical protein